MARYRIICTRQEPVTQPTTHAHIVSVGTGVEPTQYNQTWTLAQVLTALAQGHTFYTQGQSSGRQAEVHPFKCPHCQRQTIRSATDGVWDNNLDSLPGCG
jgi:hypothetical protein